MDLTNKSSLPVTSPYSRIGIIQPPRKIRSSPPDITVVVGTGDAREEFECYKVALSFASPYFDAMLTANMAEKNDSRIEFPTKDPKEWKMFYPFIDPSRIGEGNRCEIIHDGNVMILVPWFQEFQMNSCLADCDRYLSKKVLFIGKGKLGPSGFAFNTVTELDRSFWFWDRDNVVSINTQRMRSFQRIMQLLQFSCMYDLEETKKYTEDIIRILLRSDMLSGTFDLFDLSTVKKLTELFLPLGEEEEHCWGEDKLHFVSRGKSDVLWIMLEHMGFDAYQLEGLSLEEINNSRMFPMLIKTFLESTALREVINKRSA